MNPATIMEHRGAGMPGAKRAGEASASGSGGNEPLRRCIVTGTEAPRSHMLRFVLSPEGQLTPDLAARLPGRGAWVAPSAEAVAQAVKKKLFNRAFSGPAQASADLPGLVERLLAERMVEALGLARRAGQAVSGAEKVEEFIAQGRAAVVLLASDAGADAKRRFARPRPGTALVETLSADEIGRAFARDRAVHAAVAAGGLGRRLIRDSFRLAGFRPAGAEQRGSDNA
jgi:predicted RNA-binding protein YlxR (DUF448 family)